MNPNLTVDATRRAVLGAGFASVLVAAGCGGGGGGGVPGAAPSQPPVENPPGGPLDPVVDARAWQLARQVDRANVAGVEVGQPEIALDGSRGGMAVWIQIEQGRTVLMASRYAPGGAWQPHEQIDVAVGGVPAKPRVAMDARGNALVVWERSLGGTTNVVCNRFDVETRSWEIARVLQRDFVTEAADPQVAMDSAGNAVAVWSQARSDLGRVEILSNTYRADVGWTDVILPVDGTFFVVEASFNPKLQMDAFGNAYVVWQRFAANGTGNEIWSSVLPVAVEGVTQVWGPVMEVSRHSVVQSSDLPDLAVASSGVAMVVWRRETGSGGRGILARRLLPGAAHWEPAISVAAQVGGQDDPVPDHPRVAIDPAGYAVAVWDQVSAAGGRTICASRFSPAPAQGDSPWSIPVNLERVRGGLSTEPQVAMDDSGNAVVVWGQRDVAGEPVKVLSARYVVGNDQWSTSGQRLQLADAPAGSGAKVVLRPEGTAIGIWKQVAKTGGGDTEGSIWSADFQ